MQSYYGNNGMMMFHAMYLMRQESFFGVVYQSFYVFLFTIMCLQIPIDIVTYKVKDSIWYGRNT